MNLTDIVNRVAAKHEVSPDTIRGFIWEALYEITLALNNGNDLTLRGLGSFYWKIVKEKGPTKICDRTIPAGWKLRFKPALVFQKRRIALSDNEGKVKYAVEMDKDIVKTAAESGTSKICPSCQRHLDDGGACPVHGTEPLEAAPQTRKFHGKY